MEIQCVGCQKRLKLPDNAVGKQIKCPSCQQSFVVPQPSQTGKFEAETQDSPSPNVTTPSTSPDPGKQKLLNLIASSKNDLERALKDRDEAMEMVDSIFQLFMDRAAHPDLPLDQKQEYQEIAQKVFGLQRRFPLLSGVKDALLQCENTIRNS